MQRADHGTALKACQAAELCFAKQYFNKNYGEKSNDNKVKKEGTLLGFVLYLL